MRGRERRLRTVATRMTVRQRVAALLAAGPGNTAVSDDIGRGLTPAGWAELHRYADRLDQLNATVRACLTRAESEIDMLQWIAYRRITTTQLAILVESLQDALDGWQPRHGRGGGGRPIPRRGGAPSPAGVAVPHDGHGEHRIAGSARPAGRAGIETRIALTATRR